MYEFELLKKVSLECLQALLEIIEYYIIFSNPTCPYDECEPSESKDYCCHIAFRRIIAMHE
jgi:hypothetical protein